MGCFQYSAITHKVAMSNFVHFHLKKHVKGNGDDGMHLEKLDRWVRK